MAKVTAAVIELAEAATWVVAPGGALTLTLAFDEYVIEVDARYPGRPIPLSGPPPTAAELLDAPDGAALALSALMLRRLAEQIRVKDTEGTRRIRLRFAH